MAPLDGSKFSIHALNFAINLAKFTGSKITGIFVISVGVSPVPLDQIFDPLSSIEPKDHKSKMTKKGRRILEQAEKRCMQNKIIFAKNVMFGNPGNNVIRFAEIKKNDVGLVIMGSRGQWHAGGILLERVSCNVVHKSKKSVMIVK